MPLARRSGSTRYSTDRLHLMPIIRSLPLVDGALQPFSPVVGNDFVAYRNHVYRVLNFFMAMRADAAPPPDTAQIAAAFHDLGIWKNRTFDYLAPSIGLAAEFLADRSQVDRLREVTALIQEHHKLRAYRGKFADTVEAFRRADWVDVSLGMLRFGLPSDYIRSVRQAFPNRGFHWRLVTLTARQFARTPLNPLPMMRW